MLILTRKVGESLVIG
ncbi:MAG: carbon storage regulator, partial [Cycloclasticus sp.]|nr:carbon storage regulator [Cycloclasticus sp.]MBQ0789685.1 carbon storage regulator [Cycloclasticus sp.]